MDMTEVERQSAAELEVARDQLKAAQERVAELETIHEGAVLALKRYRNVSATVGPQGNISVGAADSAEKQEPPPISHLAHMALAEFGRAAKTDEIRDKIAANGRDLSHEQVRAALSYLARSKRIERRAPGLWRVRKEPPPQSPSPAMSGAGANGTSEKGPVIGGVAVPVPAGFNSH